MDKSKDLNEDVELDDSMSTVSQNVDFLAGS